MVQRRLQLRRAEVAAPRRRRGGRGIVRGSWSRMTRMLPARRLRDSRFAGAACWPDTPDRRWEGARCPTSRSTSPGEGLPWWPSPCSSPAATTRARRLAQNALGRALARWDERRPRRGPRRPPAPRRGGRGGPPTRGRPVGPVGGRDREPDGRRRRRGGTPARTGAAGAVAALARLPVLTRATLALRYVEERSWAEVAWTTGLSERATRRRAERGLAAARSAPATADGARRLWEALRARTASGPHDARGAVLARRPGEPQPARAAAAGGRSGPAGGRGGGAAGGLGLAGRHRSCSTSIRRPTTGRPWRPCCRRGSAPRPGAASRSACPTTGATARWRAGAATATCPRRGWTTRPGASEARTATPGWPRACSSGWRASPRPRCPTGWSPRSGSSTATWCSSRRPTRR